MLEYLRTLRARAQGKDIAAFASEELLVSMVVLVTMLRTGKRGKADALLICRI